MNLSPFNCQDLALRTDEVKEAQMQYAECYRRLQQVEGELASVKNKLKEVESEKSYMEQQLCVYLKDFEEEKRKFEERERTLSDAVRKNTELQEYIQKVCSIHTYRGFYLFILNQVSYLSSKMKVQFCAKVVDIWVSLISRCPAPLYLPH